MNVVEMKTNQVKAKRTIGEQTIYTQELLKLLRTIPQEETVTYEQMEKAMGLNPRSGHAGYPYLRTAMMVMERDHDVVFENVRTVGIRHMTPEEVALSVTDAYISRKKRLVKKHIRKVNTLNDAYEGLTPTARQKTTLARTLLAFEHEAAKQKHVRAIEADVAEKNRAIGFKDTLALFK